MNQLSITTYFDFAHIDYPIKSYKDYLQPIAHDMSLLTALENVHLYYATNEIPIFYYFKIPELALFKLYAWGRSVWELPQLKNTAFSFDMMAVYREELALTQKILEGYSKIDSTEIWHLNIINNTTSQIKYYIECGLFNSPNEAILLCEKLIELFKQLKFLASVNRKFGSNGLATKFNGKIQLYNNQMFHTSNTLLISYDESFILYNTFENPNFLKSNHSGIGKYTLNWFQKMIKRTEAIDGTDEKRHNIFFNQILQKLENFKTEVMALCTVY